MNETIDCTLYQRLINSDLPEVLNDKENRLENLRYLVLTAMASCDPSAVAKDRFSLSDLREVAAHLRFDFEFYHGAPKILEEILAPANLVNVIESEGKPRYYYTITENGWHEVLGKIETLKTLAQIIELKKKIILSKGKRISRRGLPTDVSSLLDDSVSAADLDSIEADLVEDLQVTQRDVR